LDDYIGNYSDAPRDGSALTGRSDKKVLRGGSWNGYPALCRSAFRVSNVAGFDYYLGGFRVVCGAAWTL
jgi:formylglycine-generating enzyme required for sulfatase activity